MAKGISKPEPNPIVGKIVKDPKSPPQALCLRGFVGDSSEEKSIRLYFDPNFSDYVDVPEDAILHSEPVPEAWSPFGAMYVWIERDADLMHGSERIKANFMQGRIFQQQVAAQAATPQAQVQAPFAGGAFPGGPIPGGPGGVQISPPLMGCFPSPSWPCRTLHPDFCPTLQNTPCCPPTPRGPCITQVGCPTPVNPCPQPTPVEPCPQTPIPNGCPQTPGAPFCPISPLHVCAPLTPACQPMTPNFPDTTFCPQTPACPPPTPNNCGPLPFGRGPMVQQPPGGIIAAPPVTLLPACPETPDCTPSPPQICLSVGCPTQAFACSPLPFCPTNVGAQCRPVIGFGQPATPFAGQQQFDPRLAQFAQGRPAAAAVQPGHLPPFDPVFAIAPSPFFDCPPTMAHPRCLPPNTSDARCPTQFNPDCFVTMQQPCTIFPPCGFTGRHPLC